MDSSVTVWMASSVASDLQLHGNEFPGKILEINQLVYEVLRDGKPRDIIVLPYFRTIDDILVHVRERGLSGPIIVYTSGEAVLMNLLDLASQGVLFMDAGRFSKPFILGFLYFLLRSQELVHLPDSTARLENRRPRPPQDEGEVRDLFRRIMSHRTRLTLTCQFRDTLPTLTVTCSVIQMVGEVETKLVLDKFDPEEFVGLYNSMGRRKPLSGFISLNGGGDGEEALGFELRMLTAVRGRMTVLLPEQVYEQKRRFFRVEPEPQEPVMLVLLPEDGPTERFVVRDVSEGGLGIEVPYDKLERDKEYPMALEIPHTDTVLGHARVVFKGKAKGDLTAYGLLFDLHPQDLNRVRYYVFKRQAGILAAVRDLTI